MKDVLIICEANICRSPMAEGIWQTLVPGTTAMSAGLTALVGIPADSMASRLMRELGIDISKHRGTQVTREMCLRSDLVLTMDNSQRKRLEDRYPQVCGRVFRLGEFIRNDIPDPYQRDESAFRVSLTLIQASIREWIERLEKIGPRRS